MVGRVIIGIGVGVCSMIQPVYIAELSPTEIRGKLVGAIQFAITLGLLVSSCLAFALGDKWRLMLGLAAVLSTLQMLTMICMPESPRWLSKMNKQT